MYFDPLPKERREDLYNFEKELNDLLKYIKRGERIVVLKGLRRTGKTSLMKVAANQLNLPHAFVDGRIISPERKEVYRALLDNALTAIRKHDITQAGLDTLKEISLNLMGVSLSFVPKITMAFEQIDRYLSDRSLQLVLFIDEAQQLKKGNIDGIIAYLFENTRHISFVLAGSEIGLLDEIIGEDVESNLFGRPKEIIPINPLLPDKSLDFLRKGFEQIGKHPEHLEKYVDELDGIIGWLTLFGYYSIDLPLDKALQKVKHEAAKIISHEIAHFLVNKRRSEQRYLRVLEICLQPMRWGEIKHALEAMDGKPLNDKLVTDYLTNLIKHGFLIKQGEFYVVPDPLVRNAIRKLKEGKK